MSVGKVAQYQIVRLNGTVLLDALAHYPSTFLGWDLEPGWEILGACAARWRLPPDESWTPVIYFPDGFPGISGDWPEGAREALATSA